LSFGDKPDYNYLRNMFLRLFAEKGYTFDYQYDWLDVLKPVVLSPKNKKLPSALQRNDIHYPRELKFNLPLATHHVQKTIPVQKEREEIEDFMVPDEDKAIENLHNLENQRSTNPFSKYSIKDEKFFNSQEIGGRPNNNVLYSLQKIQSSGEVDENVQRKAKTHSNLDVPMRGRFKGSHQTKEEAYKSIKTGSIVIDDSSEEGTMSMTFGPDKYVKDDKFHDENLLENSITEWKDENLLARWIICSKFSINNKNA